ncbi:MAG TPA: RNA polymerase sigma factor [Armatimonadota bacterium]|nr:RNA polymerase sigma factor [Armatimonadota bacterium]
MKARHNLGEGDSQLADQSCSTQATLVAQARNGDHSAFTSLAEPHRHRIWRLAWRFTGDREDAEDLLQDALVRAYSYVGSFGDGREFGPWLMKIAVNACLAHRKRRERRSAAHQAAETLSRESVRPGNPSETARRRELRAQVRAAIAALPRRQRAAAVLFEIEGHDIREVASLMGCRPGTVKRHLHRARVALAIRLAGIADDVASTEGGCGT